MIIILTLAAGVAVVFAKTKKIPEQVVQQEAITPVAVEIAKMTDSQILLTGWGTAEQTRQLKLQTEIKGRIISLHPELNLGGFIPKGETILKLDPSEYEALLQQAKAEVANAESELIIEQGRRLIAEKEFELLQSTMSDEELFTDLSRQLAQRLPQKANRIAALEGAQGRLNQALLNVERATIYAPFNSLVITESADLGQVVSPGQTLATLVTSDYFLVIATLPQELIHWLYEMDPFPHATIFIHQDQEQSSTKKGIVERIIPSVSDGGRMVRLRIRVPDPLDLQKPMKDREPLFLDSYVRVEIPGPTLQNVFVLPRKALHEISEVFIMNKENRLESRHVTIAYSYPDKVIITDGIQEGDKVITSPIATPIEGMLLRDATEKNRDRFF